MATEEDDGLTLDEVSDFLEVLEGAAEDGDNVALSEDDLPIIDLLRDGADILYLISQGELFLAIKEENDEVVLIEKEPCDFLESLRELDGDE